MRTQSLYHIAWLISFFLCNIINTYAQSVEQEAEYADKICKKVKAIQPRYQKLIAEQFEQNGASSNIDSITFINIYTVYATKKAIKEREKGWSKVPPNSFKELPPVSLKKEDLLTYIDPQKIDCCHCFLYKDSTFIGTMSPYVNKKNEWKVRGQSFYFMDIIEKKALFKIVSQIKPDVVFEICQDFQYFLIKERRIYGIIYNYDKEEYDMVPLKEYIDKEITTSPMEKNSLDQLSREYIYGVKYPVWKREKRYEKSSNCEKAHKKWLHEH